MTKEHEYLTFTKEQLEDDLNNNPVSVIQTEVLGFCGCGSTRIINFLYKILNEIKNYDEERSARPFQLLSDRYKTHELKMLKLIEDNKEATLDFIYYWLNAKGFMEHGSSIPGWLDAPGDRLLHDLGLVIKEREELKNEN